MQNLIRPLTGVKPPIILIGVEGRKNLTQRAKVRELIGHLSPAEIGTRLGISRQRVYQILSDEEIDYLPLNRQQRLHRRISRNLARSLGPDAAHVDRHTRGAISELLVAADLLALGWKPYVPLFRNHGHDIIASKNSIMITIEVRSALRRQDASVSASNFTRGRLVDHFAFVLPDEPVIYKPELPTGDELPREARRRGRTREFSEEQIRSAKALHDRGEPWAKAASSIKISVPRLQARIRQLCPTN